MRYSFLWVLIVPIISFAQKNTDGYAHIQPSFFINKDFKNQIALNIGVGFCPSKTMGFGASFDAYIFKENSAFLVAKADIRPFLNGIDKPVSYFISAQPGWVAYNKKIRIGSTTVESKGNLAFDLLFGIRGISPGKKSIGITMAAGYSLLAFTINETTEKYNAFKIQAGIAF